MKINHKEILIAITSVLFSNCSTLSATVLTFDAAGVNLGSPVSGTVFESGYTYQQWLPFPLTQQLYYEVGQSGLGISSPACSASCSTTSFLSIQLGGGGLFHFQSLDYGPIHSQGLMPTSSIRTLIASGYLGGSLIGSSALTATASGGFSPSWTSVGAGSLSGIPIDELRIALDSGVSAFIPLTSFERIDNVSLERVVPEPATWAMMLAGFGLMGSALRRRTKHAVRLRYA